MPFFFENQILDPERRELRRDAVQVSLEPQVFDLLLYLVRNRDRVVSKEDLIATVWRGRMVSDSTLTSRINAARKAIGDSGEAQTLIRTLARKGFRFVGEVRGDEVREAAAPLPVVASSFAVGPSERPAIAVLPFTNMGDDTEQEYFADGISEDIITALSKWRSFPVIARNSTFTYKGRSVDVRQIGRDLGARYVLEGSVRKANNRVRITAQLIDAVSAAHLWAERYDRELVDVFDIHDELSQRIAAVVEPELGRHEQRLSAAKPATVLEAWDCLHRGMHLLYKFTKADIAAARPYFERAIELDPVFSRAHTSLAYTHQLDILHNYTADRPASIAELLRLAKRGVELDEDDSYAHMMLCFAYRWAGEFALSIAEGRKAIEVNPSDAWALATLGNSLDLSGQSREGLAFIERALALTPRDPHAKFYMSAAARACVNNRDHAAAESWARKSIGQDPGHARGPLMLAVALGHLGRRDEAQAALEACERIQQGFAATWIAGREYRNPADNEHFAEGLRKAGMDIPPAQTL